MKKLMGKRFEGVCEFFGVYFPAASKSVGSFLVLKEKARKT
jgi:hypothetical protein